MSKLKFEIEIDLTGCDSYVLSEKLTKDVDALKQRTRSTSQSMQLADLNQRVAMLQTDILADIEEFVNEHLILLSWSGDQKAKSIIERYEEHLLAFTGRKIAMTDSGIVYSDAPIDEWDAAAERALLFELKTLDPKIVPTPSSKTN
jgi:hypothetical protein